jgi:endonuclease/exonuclease/phosphatase (EEP) superfamily protein YafD
VVANTHLSFVPGWSQWQLQRIRRDLAGVAGPVLLMGDLNMTGSQAARITRYRLLAQHPTFPLETPHRQLDHILARGNLGRVTESAAPQLPLSDHRPLVVELTPSPQGGP